MPAKVRDLRVCPFSLRQTLAGWLQFNIYKICIWTTYIHCTTIDVKITAFTKNDPPNGIQNDSSSSEISSILFPSGQCAFPIQSWSTVSRLSLSLSPSFSFWFIFDWISLSLHFLSLHLLFSILFQDLAFPSFWLAVIAFALSFRSFLWFGFLKCMLQTCVILAL